MADTKILLGDFEFTHTEVPESVTLAIAQKLSINKFVGGRRSGNAMGKDDHDITWSGVFAGTNALDRIAFLRYLTAQGTPLLLSLFDFKFSVLIRNFSPQIERYYRIPYSISFVVIEDLSNPVTTPLPAGFLDAIYDDLAAASDLVQLIEHPPITAAFEVLSAYLGGLTPNGPITKTIRGTIERDIGGVSAPVGQRISELSGGV